MSSYPNPAIRGFRASRCSIASSSSRLLGRTWHPAASTRNGCISTRSMPRRSNSSCAITPRFFLTCRFGARSQGILSCWGSTQPERALDLATLTGRYGRPDFAAGLKRAGIESIPGLLSRELLPLGTLHASDLDGPFHTLRHPRLSDMAVRAFMIGKHATLPKLPAPESAEIGSQNSLLRRYVGGEKGPLPEGVSEIAVREMVKLQLLAEAATLLADWRRADPKSEALNALLTELRSQPPIRSADRRRGSSWAWGDFLAGNP